MRFAWDILVTPEDKETNKKVVTLPLAHGIITLVSILFPPGCHKMVHCVIRHYEHAIFPSSQEIPHLSSGTSTTKCIESLTN